MKADRSPLFIAALLAKKKKGESSGAGDVVDEGSDEVEADPQSEALSAMEDFISAVHAKDSKLALQCWDQLCELHTSSEKGEGEEY